MTNDDRNTKDSLKPTEQLNEIDRLLDLDLLDSLEVSTGHVQRAQIADQGALDEAVAAIPDRMRVDHDAPTPCAFITGVAGSGKSYTCRERCSLDPLYGMLASSTGISAINLNTVTIHSLLGFFDTDSLRDAYIQGGVQRRLKKLAADGYRNIIIDECSMIGRETLDLLVRAFDDVNLQAVGEGKDSVGLILVGDFCLSKGTLVMRYDGALISCEEVKVGDVLMGPDFLPRVVRKTCSGTDHLYRVKQTNGDDYVVNSKHRIALKRGPDGVRADNGKDHNLLRYPKYPSEFAMSVTELAEKPQRFRKCFVGYKAGCVPLSERPLLLDPYFLGLWLGDGDKDRAAVTTPDPEVKDFWMEYAALFGLPVVTQRWDRTEAVKLTITNNGKRGGRRPNPIIQLLRHYNLYKNKHIPVDFMLNSIDNRLRLLAGLLDTDGSWTGNRYVITQVKKDIAYQIKQLADGLGFRTGIRHFLVKSSFGNHATDAWTVTIGGDTWRIPCRVARKISVPRNLGRSRMTSSLTIESAGVGEYFGFEVDGDSRFLLGDGTVTYNCQLPPIADRPQQQVASGGGRRRALPTPWAFDSQFWSRFSANETILKKIWRQVDSRFLAALNFARSGRGRDCVQVLQSAGQRFESFVDYEFDGTTIVGKNDEVDRINQIRLDKVKGRPIHLPSRRWAAKGKLRKEWQHVPERTVLRENAYVMILANKYEEGRMVYANGDCGWVKGIQPSVGRLIPPSVMVELVRTGEIVHVESLVRGITWSEPPDWVGGEWTDQLDDDGKYCPKPHYRKAKKHYVTGQIEYYPLRVAYASTVHRSQGLSLDKVQVDFRGWMFKGSAMTYVSLSRCRSLEGLRLVGMPDMLADRCVVDPKVRRWL